MTEDAGQQIAKMSIEQSNGHQGREQDAISSAGGLQHGQDHDQTDHGVHRGISSGPVYQGSEIRVDINGRDQRADQEEQADQLADQCPPRLIALLHVHGA